jgi:uncharacterized protein Yka (UPF0111/DUF47 family)
VKTALAALTGRAFQVLSLSAFKFLVANVQYVRCGMKARILAQIGEQAPGCAADAQLDRRERVNAALAANDRIKYYLSLLQMAAQKAIAGADGPGVNLREERLACGVPDASLDRAVELSAPEGQGIRVPGCAKVLSAVAQDLQTMAYPVLEEPGAAARLEKILSALPHPADDVIDPRAIQEIVRAANDGGDTLDQTVHQFVMHLHKRLNAIQGELAELRLDGAAVFGIEDADRPVISAFMSGLHRTAWLKFSHPGLETTATRLGDKLVIQNDLGTTDAHVIVIHVQGSKVGVTYTDVHPERAEFFRQMLAPYQVSWGEERADRLPGAGKDADFLMLVGTFTAEQQAQLEEYLTFLGSRLVFLIDWNRARKQLRGFLKAPQRTEALRWAAENEIGHRGFLELGGAQLINQAIEKVSGSAIHFGDQLCDVLGDEAAADFVRFVLHAATEGLIAHQSARLIHDRVCAELQAHFSTEGRRLLDLAGEHAGLIFELASQVREGVAAVAQARPRQDFEHWGKRARGFEHDADQLVAAAREAVRKRPEYAPVFQVTEAADDAADELEEVAFLLGLLAATKPGGDPLDALAKLAALLLEASQEYVKALSHAGDIHKNGQTEDADDFLRAIDRLMDLEHQADDAERALSYAAVQHARNFRQLHLFSEIGASLESATDALKSAGLRTRDYLFTEVLGA